MSQAEVQYRIHNGNAWLTLNNECARNALSPEMLRELDARLDQAAADPDARSVVLTGAGEAAFSAGADIAYLSAAAPAEVRAYARTAVALTEKIEVAAINGHALGGGLEIAEACTFRIAVQGARLGHPEVRIGAVAGFGGTSRLPRLVGRTRATELLLTGDTITAEEALTMGLIHRAVSADMLHSACEELLTRVHAGAPHALRLTRDALQRGMELPLDAALRLGANHFGLAAGAADFREGTAAFLAKRPPQWAQSQTAHDPAPEKGIAS